MNKGDATAHMIVEIPKGSHAKLEISKEDVLNPIKQDIKVWPWSFRMAHPSLQNGKLRYIHDAYPFNYGAFPQTWENPCVKDEDVGEPGTSP